MTNAEFKEKLLTMAKNSLLTDPDCLNGPGYEFKVENSVFQVNADKLPQFIKNLNKLKGQALDQKGKPWKTSINRR